MLQTRWADLKFLAAMLANNSLHSSIIPHQTDKSQIIQGDARDLGNLLVDRIITSNKGQSESNMSIVYITFFEVDNPIALLVKTLVPSSIFSSLSGRTMPEIAISLNNGNEGGQEEINKISTNPELTDKLNPLLVKVFGNCAFKAREPSFPVTFKGAENTPIPLNLIGIDIEGIPTESTVAFYIDSASGVKTFTGAKHSDASFNLVSPYPELLITGRTSPPYPSTHTSNPTTTGTVFASVISKLTRSSSKELPAYLASFLNTNFLSQDIIPLTIIPQISTIITSPHYGNPRDIDEKSEQDYEDKRLGVTDKQHGRTQFRGRYEVDSIITSLPYEGQEKDRKDTERELSGGVFNRRSYRPGDAYSR